MPTVRRRDRARTRGAAPALTTAGQVVGYAFRDPPLAVPTPVTFRQREDGQPEVVAEVAHEGSPTSYVFTFVGSDLAATPTP
jgi:hypothetical protein